MDLLRSLFGDDVEIVHDQNLQMLLLANTVPAMGTGLLSPILDSLIDPLGTSAADIGLMLSFFTAPSIIMIPITGMLCDRYGRKPILIVSLLLFGAAGSAIAFTTEYRIALGLRLLQGAGFGGILPTIITSIGDIYSGTEEATAQGIRFTVSGLGFTVFPFLSSILVAIAWQYPFFVHALSFPIALVVYLSFTEPARLDNTISNVTRDGDAQSQLSAVFGLVARRRILMLILARGLPMVVWIGFLTYNSIVVVQVLNGTPLQAGALVAVASFTMMGAASQAGRISATFNSRLYPLVGAHICLGVGFATFLYAPLLSIAGIGLLIVGVGVGLTLSLYRSVITGLVDDTLRGSLVSLAETSGRITSTVTPVLMGWIIAVAQPQIGIGPAIQMAGLGAAVVGGAGGVIALLVVKMSPPIHPETTP